MAAPSHGSIDPSAGSRDTQPAGRPTGTLYVGTSGFAYRSWAPAFYPAGARADDLLGYYSARLPACELNNTFYRQPSPEAVAGWVAATPSSFRFAVKAQRGGTLRTFADPSPAALAWLTGPLTAFGERLGTVLFRIPGPVLRDDARLAALLAAWPSALPLTVEAQDASWQVDETFAALAAAGATLCVTELDDPAEPPTLRLTGSFLYVRLRRSDYAAAELAAWAARLLPFLADGRDAFVFFRHDEAGEAPGRALRLAALVAAELPAAVPLPAPVGDA
ncbi:MAG TPA: DUF72 domain-containing protein [Candidatus Limnocylindrales bacterium]